MVVALVPSGAVAGHVLGYLVAGQDAALRGTHSHLRPAAWAAAALAATALGCLAMLRPVSRRDGPRLGSLVSAQVALFALVEAGEHVLGGHGATSFVKDPSFRWGVLAQLVSAAVLIGAARMARATGERVRALLARRPRSLSLTSRQPLRPVRVVVGRRRSGSSVTERGPPRLLAAT